MDIVGRVLVRIATIAVAKAIDKLPDPPKTPEQIAREQAELEATKLKEEQERLDRIRFSRKWAITFYIVMTGLNCLPIYLYIGDDKNWSYLLWYCFIAPVTWPLIAAWTMDVLGKNNSC